MSIILTELAILLALILTNGLFSMAELAVVSSRRVRLKNRADQGDHGAVAALELAADPNRFLPTVQVGITLIGTLAGAYGGAALAQSLSSRVEQVPSLAKYADEVAIGLVVLGITYVTLVLGELVPKRIALSRPERIAALVGRPMRLLSRLAVPVVRLLGGSTELIVRGLGVPASSEPPVTEEEVKILLEQGRQAGVFDASESEIVRRVFRLGDRRAGMLMTPRKEVVWLDVADSPEVVRRKIEKSPHSRFPVCEGGLDNVIGIVQVKDLLLRGFTGRQAYDLRGLLIMPLFLYEGMPGFEVLERFKSSGTHIAMVLDEYGSIEGLITLNDILEALVGDLPEPDEEPDPTAVQRADGSWLLDGRMPLDEVAEVVGIRKFPEGDYHTLAGFVIDRLGHIPNVAEVFDWLGTTFEVVDMDGRRIDKVLVKLPTTPGETVNGGPQAEDLGPQNGTG